jgi:hypothetical protein
MHQETGADSERELNDAGDPYAFGTVAAVKFSTAVKIHHPVTSLKLGNACEVPHGTPHCSPSVLVIKISFSDEVENELKMCSCLPCFWFFKSESLYADHGRPFINTSNSGKSFLNCLLLLYFSFLEASSTTGLSPNPRMA